MGLIGGLGRLGLQAAATALGGPVGGAIAGGALSQGGGLSGKLANAGTSFGLGQLGNALGGAEQGQIQQGFRDFEEEFQLTDLDSNDFLGRIAVMDLLEQQKGVGAGINNGNLLSGGKF